MPQHLAPHDLRRWFILSRPDEVASVARSQRTYDPRPGAAFGETESFAGRSRFSIARLHSLGLQFLTYVRSTRGAVVNHGKRHQAGLRAASTLAQSAVNSLVGKRMVKKQRMRWSRHNRACRRYSSQNRPSAKLTASPPDRQAFSRAPRLRSVPGWPRCARAGSRRRHQSWSNMRTRG